VFSTRVARAMLVHNPTLIFLPRRPAMPTIALSHLDAALEYAGHGWHVHPLRVKLKTPATYNGFDDATTDADTLKAWWADTHVKIGQTKENDPNDSTKRITVVHYTSPDLNLGIATGKKSGLVVIDLDPDKGGTPLALQALYGELPETLCQRTGSGGLHLLYHYPEGINYIKCSQSVLAPGIDVRADGGYICAPPSLHPNGKRYEWINPETALAELPTSLLQAMLEGKKQKANKTDTGAPFLKGRPGGRSGALCHLAGIMRRTSFTFAEIKAAIQVANQTRCKPPLTDDELDKQVLNSAAKWERGEIKESRRIVLKESVKLEAEEIRELRWIIKDIIPEGITMIAGRPKAKKSFLGLGLAIAYARGSGQFMEYFDVGSTGRVLYFGLEDSERRLQERQRMLGADAASLDNLVYGDYLKLDVAGIENLRQVLSEAKDQGKPFKLVVIDPFLTAAPSRSGKSDPVRADYSEIDALKDIASEFGLDIVIINHTGKEPRGEDVLSLSNVLGTTGVTAAVDTIIILGRTKDDEPVMAVKGKDVYEKVFTLDFDLDEHRGWLCLGEALPKLKGDRKLIMDQIQAAKGHCLKLEAFISALGKPKQLVYRLLQKMIDQGLIQKLDHGTYGFLHDQTKESEPPKPNFDGMDEADSPESKTRRQFKKTPF
jgi:hypothetical protein